MDYGEGLYSLAYQSTKGIIGCHVAPFHTDIVIAKHKK